MGSNSSHIDIPADVRRDAINKYFLQQRAQEEIDLLEIKRFVSSLHSRIGKLTTSLPQAPLDEQSPLEMGKSGMINSRIHELCVKVLTLRKLFALYYIDAHQLPNEEHEYDLFLPDTLDEEQQKEIDYWHSVAEEHFERMEKLQELEKQDLESCDESEESDDMSD